ncbi:MAG: MMPL family transporter [Betaproteobacteria bacterium]
MRCAARWPVAVWLSIVLAGAAAVAVTPIRTDLAALLPQAPSVGSRLLIEQLRSGAAGRLVLGAVSGGEAPARAAAVQALAAALRDDSGIAAVDYGSAAQRRAWQQYFFEHRYLLSPAVRDERFGTAGLREAIESTLAEAAGATGMLAASLLARDPTGETLQLLEWAAGRNPPRTAAGVWASRDGTRALMLIRLQASAIDSQAQQAALAAVRARFAAVAPEGLVLTLSGAPVFAVEARSRIQREVALLATVALALVIGVLLLAYRSPRLLALSLLPVLTATLAGFAAVAAVYGSVHGLTLAFGVTMIGEAVDYAVYYLLAPDRASPAWAARQWPAIRLGLLTSVAGLAVLLLSGFPGLSQLGLFSIVGLVVAAATTRHLLPLGLPAQPAPPRLVLARRLDALAAHAVRRRWLLTGLAFGCAALPLLRPGPLWDSELERLSPVPAQARAFDARLRADLGLADARVLAAVAGADPQAALAAAERAGATLAKLTAAGHIGGYDSAAHLLPSAVTQQRRIAALPEPVELRRRLEPALEGLPLRPAQMEAFVADVERARRGPPLLPADLAGTPPAQVVDALLVPAGDPAVWWALLPLYPPAGTATVDAAAIGAALAGSAGPGQVEVIDLKAETGRIYADYFAEARRLVALAASAIVLLLVWQLRSLRALLHVLRPLVLAVAAVLGLLLFAQGPLSLLHLIALLLVVAVGSNYALLLAAPSGGEEAPRLPVSLAVAGITTVCSFGVLALSSVPSLTMIGSTAAAGVLAALVYAVAWQPRG